MGAYKIKNDTIWHKCAACDAKEMVDMNHRLVNFILAEDKKAKKEGKGKDDKKKKKKKDKDDSDDDIKKKKIEKYAPAISLITNGNKIMERHLISALEGICVEKPKHFPVMLKQLYDEDALAEETLLEWADEGRNEFTLDIVDEDSRANLRGEAEPVVVWLQEADSEEDDDDDD